MASQNPIVLITGANQGIGYETARILAASSTPYTILIAGRRLEACQEAADALKKDHPNTKFEAIKLDITNETDIDAAAAHVEKTYGRLDILINNAAVFVLDLTDERKKRERLRATLETNIVGTAAVTNAFLPLLLKAAKEGGDVKLIVLTSSLGSIEMASRAPKHRLNVTDYRVSKAGVNMLTVEWAKAFEDDGIRVWGVDPGLCATSLVRVPEATNWARSAGARPASDGARPVVEVIEGKWDGEVGKVISWEGSVRPW